MTTVAKSLGAVFAALGVAGLAAAPVLALGVEDVCESPAPVTLALVPPRHDEARTGALAFVPPPPSGESRAGGPDEELAAKEFIRPELILDTDNIPIHDVRPALAAGADWSRFFEENGEEVAVFIDPGTGHPTNIVLRAPLLPGTGFANTLTLGALGERLRQSIPRVDADVAGGVVRLWVEAHAEVLGITADQLGEVRAARVGEDLWNVSIPQVAAGIGVRGARLVASINHGNLVIIGTSDWAEVRIDTIPALPAEDALAIGLGYAGDAARPDPSRRPRLEIVPARALSIDDLQSEVRASRAGSDEDGADGRAGVPAGSGLDHRLVWTFGIVTACSSTFLNACPPDGPDARGAWEAMVDARTGELLALQNTATSLQRRIAGGVYPLTSTGVCPSPDRCGVMQSLQPMPFADTALPAPHDVTNSAGAVDGPAGSLTTTLTGRYVRIVDSCGAINESTMGPILDLGGVNGQHDCASGGASPGNTPAARSTFYEINKLVEAARGWLPANPWLQSQLRVNVNVNGSCGASYSPGAGTLSFYRSGNGCRNTGELAGVFDHEWGHGMDDNDAAGALSNSTEAYADIAAIYRQRISCIGYGFYWTIDNGCGMTSDGTGFNANEAQSGGAHCDLDCSGVRDADYDRHSDHTPDTPLNYVCGRCLSGSGPCGRQTHCAAAPSTQAAWDFVARDLQAPPFSLTPIGAFIVANRIFYQGSGNIGLWHACTCGVSSNGCAAANAYMNWLAADDDNGNLADGTPHMTALFAAFNRHGIACAVPAPSNSGCAGGPTSAPSVTLSPGSNAMRIDWTTVLGATTYWVMRTEGHAGCGGGMVRVASVPGTSYTDLNVVDGRTYAYVVVPQGASEACSGPVSACAQAAPRTCDTGEVPATAVWTAGGKNSLSWDAVPGAGSYRIYEGARATMPDLLTTDDDSCLRWTGADTTSGPVLVETPDPGAVVWYLIVAALGACEGPSGAATAGPRILNSTGPCG